jgi:hypothetical protein
MEQDIEKVIAELEQLDPATGAAARRRFEQKKTSKTKRWNARLTETQYAKLYADAEAAGFPERHVVDYFILKMELGE